jgi:hypothetical protein
MHNEKLNVRMWTPKRLMNCGKVEISARHEMVTRWGGGEGESSLRLRHIKAFTYQSNGGKCHDITHRI